MFGIFTTGEYWNGSPLVFLRPSSLFRPRACLKRSFQAILAILIWNGQNHFWSFRNGQMDEMGKMSVWLK